MLIVHVAAEGTDTRADQGAFSSIRGSRTDGRTGGGTGSRTSCRPRGRRATAACEHNRRKDYRHHSGFSHGIHPRKNVKT